jgi:hypothetical protein
MREDAFTIQLNIDHYRAHLKLDMDEGKRSIIERLLDEARNDLVEAMEPKVQA